LDPDELTLQPGLPDSLFFKPKIPIWVNLGRFCYGNSWYILRPLEIFNGHLVYFVVIWYIFPILVFWTKKNLATLFAATGGPFH
jgi:hypothetical protein